MGILLQGVVCHENSCLEGIRGYSRVFIVFESFIRALIMLINLV